MATFRDITVLRNEEKLLMKLHQTLSDQLTRLKVEELALQSMLAQKDGDNQEEEETEDAAGQNNTAEAMETENAAPVNLNLDLNAQAALFASCGMKEEEEEEEDEDEDEGVTYKDELTLFCEELCSKQK